MLTERFFPVIPAKAGTQSLAGTAWIPAFAGMTNFRWLNSYENAFPATPSTWKAPWPRR